MIYRDKDKNNEIVKKPLGKWKIYQKERYTKPIKDIKKCVVCGKISGNLLVIDFDRDLEKKHITNDQLYENINSKHEILRKCDYVVKTMHNGFQYYFYIDSIDVYTNLQNELEKKGINAKGLKTKIPTEIDGLKWIDLRCEGNITILPPSKFENMQYELYNGTENSTPLKITNDQFIEIFYSIATMKKKEKTEEILNFKKLRKPFQDILNGTIEIESYSEKTKQKKFIYWTFLFREMYANYGSKPENIYSILQKNQPAFSISLTEEQLRSHPYTDPPMTTETMKEYFPNYYPITEQKEDGFGEIIKELILKKKLDEIIPSINKSISERLDNIENEVKKLITLKERLIDIENKTEESDKIVNINERIERIASTVINLEDKIKELNNNFGIVVNRIKSLGGNPTELKNEFDNEMIMMLNKKYKIHKCKYCELPYIWQKGTNNSWIPYHINTENGKCLSIDNYDDDFDEYDEYDDFDEY